MADARHLTLALGGRWHGTYGTACCPAHGDHHPSLSLRSGADGRLLAHCHAGCDFRAILVTLQGLGLVDGYGTMPFPSSRKLARRPVADEANVAKNEKQARSCWAETMRIEGTSAQFYLRHRGITGALPPTLRFHPACWHQSGIRLPAMVARVEGTTGFAIHRTFLQPDCSSKAAVIPNKAMLGPVAGGAVRLVMAPKDQECPLVVAEGIETALSLACGLLDAPASFWAALSAPGLRRLTLPPRPGQLIVAADGDNTGRSAAADLAVRAHNLGWKVSLLPAPEGEDWNDVLRSKVAEGTGA